MTEEREEHIFVIRIATFLCLMSLFALFWATRPIALLIHTLKSEWLLAPLFTFAPMVFTFLILYHSAWHQEWRGLKRVLLSALTSCLIFGFNVFLLAMIAAIAAFLPRLLAGH